MKVKGRCAVITGAGSGIGRELAVQLSCQGCSCALVDVNAAGLDTTVAMVSGRGDIVVSSHICDVTDRVQVKRTVDEVTAEHGGAVHLLFANAGIFGVGTFDHMPEDDFDRIMRVNVDGVITSVRYFLPVLKKQQEAYILITGSLASFYPVEKIGVPYTTSKFAVRGFAESLMVEARMLYPHVHVGVIHPGIVNTAILKSSKIDNDKRLTVNVFSSWSGEYQAASPADIDKIRGDADFVFKHLGLTPARAAAIILAGIRRNSSRILVGADAIGMDLWVRLFPRIFNHPVTNTIVLFTTIGLKKLYTPAAYIGLFTAGVYYGDSLWNAAHQVLTLVGL